MMKKYVNGQEVEMTPQEEKEYYNSIRLSNIESYKAQLAATDYKAIKFAEGELSAEEYEPIRIERRALRARINELEKEL